jgi:hypothetical protein
VRRLLFVVLILVLATAGPAYGSCAEPFGENELPDNLAVVFSGVVVGSNETSALIEVERVFRGPNLERVVRVQTNASEDGLTSIDADLQQGSRYLIGADAEFRTNLCLTAPLERVSRQILDLPSRDPVLGAEQGFTETGSSPWVSAGIILIVAGGFWWLLRIRRRTHRQFE